MMEQESLKTRPNSPVVSKCYPDMTKLKVSLVTTILAAFDKVSNGRW